MKKEYIFESELFVPAPITQVFDYFSRAENLEKITPSFLGFKITTPLPIAMKPGTIIDYKLRIHGVPIKWRTRIEQWEPGVRFVDTQVKGPYKFWHHTHEFSAVEGGTLMKDRVRYVPPFGILGRMIHPFLIRPDVEKIFAHRKSVLKTLPF